ncbi:hypothetical protein IC614_11530 [Allosphingosinicella flava]|uniref:Glycine zipper 2TM domain-containing protein n=1 Tax=Allosphingosinicella flava TaxID=2771430 RepID=A0A7T2LLW4_9SPHN|nr:hypothetical protein [Sphingosinicella flava]QPQ54926.1 hypothetical protein IC614_11530 [Sphingosinicella flava]
MTISTFRAARAVKIGLLGLAVMSAGVAQAQIKLTPIERTGKASGPYEENAKPVKTAKAKPCKKKGGGLFGAIKKTGLAGVLANHAAGGGLGGVVAGETTRVAVDEAATAEENMKTGC